MHYYSDYTGPLAHESNVAANKIQIDRYSNSVGRSLSETIEWKSPQLHPLYLWQTAQQCSYAGTIHQRVLWIQTVRALWQQRLSGVVRM